MDYQQEAKYLILSQIKRLGKTQEEVALLMGMSRANFNNKINRGTLRFTEVLELMSKLGLKIEIK